MSASQQLLRAAAALLLAAGCGGGGGGDGGDIPAPRIASIDPPFGFSSAQTPVVIRGENFLARLAGSALDTTHRAWLGDAELLEVSWIGSSELHAVVPAGLPAGPKTLKVQNAYGKQGSLAGAFTVDPGGLTASVGVSRQAVNVGQAVEVSFTVGYGGHTSAEVVSVVPYAAYGEGSGTATCSAVTPAGPRTIGPQETVRFTWTCSGDSVGALTVTGTVTATDGDTHANVSATPATPAAVTVQTAAAFVATLSILNRPDPIRLLGQLEMRLTVTNTGGAGARVTAVTPEPDADCSGASPGTATLAGGASTEFAWTCAPRSTGSVRLAATVAGTDDNDPGARLTTAAHLDVQVVEPEGLAASLSAADSVNVNRDFQVTLHVHNGESGTIQVTAIQTGSSTTGVSCGAATPASRPIAAHQSYDFTWSCTAANTGDANLTAMVSRSAGTSVSASPLRVTVQDPAQLDEIVSAASTTLFQGQTTQVTLTLTNNGGASAATANVTAVGIQPAPAGAMTCVRSEGGTPPFDLPAAATEIIRFSCTAVAAGLVTLAPSVTAVDLNTRGAPPATATPAQLTVAQPLSAVLGIPATIRAGETVEVTLTVSNLPGADPASVTGVSLSAPGSILSCPALPDNAGTALPVTVAGGGSHVLHWSTCTALAVGGPSSLSATVTAATAGTSPVTLDPQVLPVSVTVLDQLAPALTLIADPASFPVGAAQAVAMRLTLTNNGSVPAHLTATAVSATLDLVNGAQLTSCTGASGVAQDIAPTATSSAFTWTCTHVAGAGLAGGSSVVGAEVAVTYAGISRSYTATAVNVTLTE